MTSMNYDRSRHEVKYARNAINLSARDHWLKEGNPKPIERVYPSAQEVRQSVYYELKKYLELVLHLDFKRMPKIQKEELMKCLTKCYQKSLAFGNAATNFERDIVKSAFSIINHRLH
jgi:hypothetical protein